MNGTNVERNLSSSLKANPSINTNERLRGKYSPKNTNDLNFLFLKLRVKIRRFQNYGNILYNKQIYLNWV